MSNGIKKSPESQLAEELIELDEAIFGKPDELEINASNPYYLSKLPYSSRRYLAIHGKDAWLDYERKRRAEQEALQQPTRTANRSWIESAEGLASQMMSLTSGKTPITLQAESGEEVPAYMSPDYKVWLEGQEVGQINPETGEFTAREPSAWEKALGYLGRGLEYAIYPFTELGMARRESGQPWYMPTTESFTEEQLATPISEKLPGGEKFEEYAALPITEKLKYEAPGWIAATLLPGATQVRAMLAPAAATRGVTGVAAATARGALAPLAGAEWLGGQALKYGLVIPLTKGIPAAARATLQVALDTGLDRWIATQGRMMPEARSAFSNWIVGNRTWLIERATQNMLRRMGRAGATAEKAAQEAVNDTIREAEPLLLQSAGIKTPEAISRTPEAGLQRGMFGEVAEVRPTGKGEIVQETLDDLAKLEAIKAQEIGFTVPVINIEQANQRINQIQDLLATKGRIPAGQGTKAELEIELARIEAQKELATMTNRGQLEAVISDIQNELGNRSMPFHGGASNIYPEYTTKQLDEQLKVYENALNKLGGPLPPTLTTQMTELYNQMQTEVEAMRAAITGMRGGEAQTARATLRSLERELSAIKTTVEQGKPTVEGAGKLRQTIMAWAKFKGISQTQLRNLFKSKTGINSLTRMTRPQLDVALNAVKKARPVRIGNKRVITFKTENKIQSLKEALIADGKLTEEYFGELTKKLPATGYVNANRFITEREGRELIQAMNDEAAVGYIGREAEITGGLERHPEIKAEVDNLSSKIAKESQVYLEGKPVGTSPLWDMRYYTQNLENKTGAPFYKIWQAANRKHLENRLAHKRYWTRIEKSTPEYSTIAGNEKALQRVSDYIAAKNKFYPVKSPVDITPEEIKLANAIEDVLFELAPDVRYYRFLSAYEKHGANVLAYAENIPDAPRADLRQAINIYESKGAGALRAYLDTKTWGVIESGYEPHVVVNPKLALRKMKSTVFGKSHLKSREGIEWLPTDKNIIQRTNSYLRQILNLNLQPYFRRIDKVFSENAGKLENPYEVSRAISHSLNEMKGYIEQGGLMTQYLTRFMGQAYAAVFLHPSLAFRNLFQNVAFHPDRTALINPTNRKLTEQEQVFFNTYINQMEKIAEEYMLGQEVPLPGLERITKFARWASLYGRSDWANRQWCFWASLNKAERALRSYKVHGDVKKFIIDSGLNDLTLAQQKEILGLMSLDRVVYGNPDVIPVDGEKAAIREIAKGITENVHFLYERAQRAPIEMGGMGRSLGSLLVFPRSYGQRMYNALKDIHPNSQASGDKKLRAWKIVLGNILAGFGAGYTYQKITGKTYKNPYNPLDILTWTPGGLAIGVVQDVFDVAGDMIMAGTGDKDALARLTSAIPSAADTLIPFYRIMIDSVEASLDVRHIDRLALRKIRELLDSEYKPNEEYYTRERTLLEKIQHALFGGEAPDPDPIKTAVKELGEWESYLGQYVVMEDGEPFYFRLSDLSSEINSAIYNLPPDEITKENGFSDLVLMYKQAEYYWDNYYYSLQGSEQRAAFRESDSDIAAWTEAYLFIWGKLTILRNERSRVCVEKLIKDYKLPEKSYPDLKD